MRPQNFFWSLFVTAKVTLKLRGSLSLVFFIRRALICSLLYKHHVNNYYYYYYYFII